MLIADTVEDIFLNTTNIDRTTATEAVDKKVDRFYGSRYHDRSISNPLHSSETKH